MAAAVLARFPDDVIGRPIRLLGVRVELAPPTNPDARGHDRQVGH